MTALVVFVLAGIGTYAARSSFILAIGDRRLPLTVERFLANIGPAVLAGLATSLLLTDGVEAYVTNAAEVSATLVAVVVAWRTRNFIWTFAAGMTVLWVVGWLV